METQNSVEAKAEAAGSAEEASTSEAKQAPDPIKNLKGEFQRKISKLDEKLTAVLNAVQARTATSSTAAEEAPQVDGDVKHYVDTVFNHQKQNDAWNEALGMFPELNPEGDAFDEKFYKAVDAEFSSNLRKDPRGPLKAAKLVAVELGKIEQLTQSKILKDEARRSRILSEGSSTPREAKKNQDPSTSFNVQGLARLGINPEKLAKRMKANKDKYEGL